MDPVLFASFIAATLLIIVPPGPSVALASSQAVKHGPRAAALTVAGDALGSVVHIIIAVASLQALIGLADIVLPYLQIAGGIFILYLAWQSWNAAATAPGKTPNAASRYAFVAGFFACVTNPKAIVFFVALFPGFISPDHGIIAQSLIYGAIFVTLDAASILGYAMLARYVVNSTLSPRINIDRVSATGLFGVGILLIVKGVRQVQTT